LSNAWIIDIVCFDNVTFDARQIKILNVLEKCIFIGEGIVCISNNLNLDIIIIVSSLKYNTLLVS